MTANAGAVDPALPVVGQPRINRIPHVAVDSRIEVIAIGEGIHRAVLHYGFMDEVDLPEALSTCHGWEPALKPMDTGYFLGRQTLIASERPGMTIWREKLFAWMQRNAERAMDFFACRQIASSNPARRWKSDDVVGGSSAAICKYYGDRRLAISILYGRRQYSVALTTRARMSRAHLMGDNDMIRIPAAAAPIVLFTQASSAFAQETETPDVTVSGSVTLASDYRFRGVSQTDKEMAVQGGLTIAHKSGVYIGTWASNLSAWGTFGGANMELDLIAGYELPLSDSATLDVGLTWYMYPGGADKTDFAEPYVKLSGTAGPATLTAGIAYAPKQQALGRWYLTGADAAVGAYNDPGAKDDNLYVWGDAVVGLKGTPLTAKAHIGYSDGNPGLALQLHFRFDMSASSGGLMRSSPARPSDDIGGPYTTLGKLVGDPPDFLD